MTRRTQLLDLPLEIQFEIIALIPYNASNWSTLRRINQHFRRLMFDRSLESKVAITQFSPLYRLLSEELIRWCPLMWCHIQTKRLQAPMEAIPMVENRIQRVLIKLVTILHHVIHIHTDDADFRYRFDNKFPPTKYIERELRSQTYFFRLLRLLPPAFTSLLRYSALKLYEFHHLGSFPLFLSARLHEGGENLRIIEDVCLFLDFECDLSNLSSIVFRVMPSGSYECNRPSWGRALERVNPEETSNQDILQQQTANLFPSAIMATRAAHHLKGTPYASSKMLEQIDFADHCPSVFLKGNVLTEAIQQMRVLRELCDQVEAEDGENAKQILQALKPEIIRPIMALQADIVARMSKEEVQKGLLDEIALAVVSTDSKNVGKLFSVESTT